MAAQSQLDEAPRPVRASMKHLKQFQQYKRMEVDTSDPMKLVVLLYEAAIKHINDAVGRIAAQDWAGKGLAIGKAVDILVELSGSLNDEQGGEIATNLRNLYSFLVTELLSANREKDPAKLDKVAGMLGNLLSAWREVERTTRDQRFGAEAK